MPAPRRPLLGLCPVGKFVFSAAAARRQKEALQAALRSWSVPFVDLDGVLEDGLVRDEAHVEPAVAHLRAAGAEALFLPHCNFGTEGAAGMIAARLGLPTLLWGPRDEAPLPDGTRERDTLCGLFASTKVLRKLGVPFTYIENCRLEEPPLRRGLERFLRAAAAARVLRGGTRLGQLGQRIDFFWTTIVNESELLERFGVEIRPLDLVAFLDHVRQRLAGGRRRYEAEAAELKQSWRIEGYEDDEPLLRVLAARDQMRALVADHGLDALAVQDFPSLVEALGSYAFLANSLLGNEVPVACEMDLHGALSLLLLHRALHAAEPVFLADVTNRHPEADDGVLLWHVGAPTGLARPGAPRRLGTHWILPSPLGGMPHFPLRDGPVTLCRFDGDRGAYALAVGEGESMPGPETQNNYLWLRVDDWPRWERLLMEGPFIHHAAMGYAHVGEALLEACRYVPELAPVRLNREPSP